MPFDYYFFDDNCSYQLLALLEVARPELRLTPEYPAWVIPVDTLRVVAGHKGLLGPPHYRPSPATRIHFAAGRLSRDERRLAREVALGDEAVDSPAVSALQPSERLAVLSLAYEYLRYLYLAKDVTREDSAPRSRKLLVALSAVEGAAPLPSPPVPRTAPEDGHPIARVGFGGGVRDNEPFVELSLRAAFHSLADPVGGYLPGANLDLGRTALRYEPESGTVRVEEVALLDVTSLTPRDGFLRPISWNFSTGWRTRLLSAGSRDDLDAHGVAYLRGAAGLTFEPVDGLLLYGLAGAAVEGSPDLDEDYAVGPSGELGLIADTFDTRCARRSRCARCRTSQATLRPAVASAWSNAGRCRIVRRSFSTSASSRPTARRAWMRCCRGARTFDDRGRTRERPSRVVARLHCRRGADRRLRRRAVLPEQEDRDHAPRDRPRLRETSRSDGEDGVALHGWLLPARYEGPEPSGTVIFFHGNAGNVGNHLGGVYWLPSAGFQVFLFDYRGFGASAGRATLAGAHCDARAAVRALAKRSDVDPYRIVAIGQSIGGAIALTTVASLKNEIPIRALVVDSAPSDFRGIAREKLGDFWLTWPFQYPLSWLVPSRRSLSRRRQSSRERRCYSCTATATSSCRFITASGSPTRPAAPSC